MIRVAHRQAVDDLDVTTYSAILVEYGAVYEASRANSHQHAAFRFDSSQLLLGFQVVSTHYDTVSNSDSLADDAAKSDDAVFNGGPFANPATIR